MFRSSKALGLVVFAVLAVPTTALAQFPPSPSGLLACGPNPGAANHVRFQSSSISMKALPVSFPAGSSQLARLQNAAAGWSNTPGSALSMNVVADDENTLSSANTENEVGFFTDIAACGASCAGSPGNAMAVTIYRFDNLCGGMTPPCCVGSTPSKILNSDVAFFKKLSDGTNIAWNYSVPPVLTNSSNTAKTVVPSYFQLTAAHEFGHVFGLYHIDTGQARMSPSQSGWYHSTTSADERADPFSRDARSAATLFPVASNTAVLWAGNMINVTNAAELFGARPLSMDGVNYIHSTYPRRKNFALPGQPNNAARVGEIVQVQWCAGNSGSAASNNLTVQWWLSSNTTLETASDISMGTAGGWSFPARTEGCWVNDLTVPNVPAGNYWVIFRLGGAVGDSRNVTVADRRVVVVP